MTARPKCNIFWFRRDLRLEDNTALIEAVQAGLKVQAIFIFDQHILRELPEDDPRVQFIYETLSSLNQTLEELGAVLRVFRGEPLEIWSEILTEFEVQAVYANEDYEPYARSRDTEIGNLLKSKGIDFYLYKDQVIFAKGEVVKDDGNPYHVFTPYKRKWLKNYTVHARPYNSDWKDYCLSKEAYLSAEFQFPSMVSLGFKPSEIRVKAYDLSVAKNYAEQRDFPWIEGTSRLGPYLRFGLVSIRRLVEGTGPEEEVFLSELIWREFFMQILYHYPEAVHQNFKKKYDAVAWRNDPDEFERWCKGQTGYPLVDAGMRELNRTGYMHNRVRMITAGFLCKHLLIDWRWGEAYFAKKLLDYELASNNGNWQWAAGTGCDAAPYFRVFNPITQQKKFDKQGRYIREWIEDLDELTYPEPMVDHKTARERALDTYKRALTQ